MKILFIFFAGLLSLGSQVSVELHAQEIGIISAAASPAGFTPADLTPLIWFDSRSADMASDGSLWTDRMGHYNLTAAVTNPVYNATALNGRPGFEFNGLNDVMSTPGVTELSNIQNYTIWMVGKRCLLDRDGGLTSQITCFVHYSDDIFYGENCNGSFTYGATGAKTNAFHYSISLFDGTQATDALKERIYYDGTLQTLSFTGGSVPTSTFTGVQSLNAGFFIGNFLAGTSCEYGVIARTLSAGEITSLNTYLAAKYGLCIGMIMPIGFTKEGFAMFYIIGFALSGAFGTYLWKTRNNFKQAA